jgi:hypothetical protein
MRCRYLFSVGVLGYALLTFGCQSHESGPSSPPKRYILPAEFLLEPSAERGPEGEIFFVGSTNLPDGMEIRVEILDGPRVAGQDSGLFIKGGRFRSSGFTSGKKPYSPGKYKAHFLSHFNNLWQTPDILALVGQRGEKLHGKMFVRTDPDVVDSPVILDYTQVITFPPLSPGSHAIALVKTAKLTVPGQTCAAQSVEQNIDQMEKLVKTLGVLANKSISYQSKRWTAEATGENSYTVTFHFVETGTAATGEQHAMWSVDLGTRRVKYLNLLAKSFSCVPE